MKAIVAGNSTVATTNYKYIKKALDICSFEITELVVASDTICLIERWARENKILIRRFLSDYDLFGSSADKRRDIEMIRYADCLIFIKDKNLIEEDIIKKAKTHGLQVKIFSLDELIYLSERHDSL